MPTALAVVLTILPGQSNRLWPCRVPYYSDWRKCVGIEQPKRQGFQMFQTCVYCTVCDVWLLMFHTDDTSAPGARLCGHPPALVAAGHLLLPLMKIIRYTVGERPQTRRLLIHITQRDILMKYQLHLLCSYWSYTSGSYAVIRQWLCGRRHLLGTGRIWKQTYFPLFRVLRNFWLTFFAKVFAADGGFELKLACGLEASSSSSSDKCKKLLFLSRAFESYMDALFMSSAVQNRNRTYLLLLAFRALLVLIQFFFRLNLSFMLTAVRMIAAH